MPGIGPFFRSDAVAGGDLATAETEPGLRERPRISEDGHWWWNGERWLATGTADGLWQWDGERWRPTIDLAGARARDLATTLAMLAEDRYARAAEILAARAREWRPEGELRDLVHRASGVRHRLARVEHAFAVASSAPGLLRRKHARPEDSHRAVEEHAELDTEHRALMVRLGRRAPQPTVKEADDLLEVARLLDQRAASITDALATADEAERARGRAIESARRELDTAVSARLREVEAAGRALALAQRARAGALRSARDDVQAALVPAAGEPAAQVGPLRAHQGFVETPAGHLAADALTASVASAVALWRQHRDLLEDVLQLETAEADAFLRCLTERRRDLFLLLAGRSRTLLWHCPPGEEKPLRRFATAVNRQADRAAELAQARLVAADEMQAVLAGGPEGGPARAVAAAGEALTRAQTDPVMARAIEEARRRLELARAEPPALLEARQRVAAEMRAVATPPAPLAPV